MSTVPDSQILAELLKHEGKKQSQHQSAAGESKGSHDSEESSSDASSDEGGMEISQAAAAPSWQVQSVWCVIYDCVGHRYQLLMTLLI